MSSFNLPPNRLLKLTKGNWKDIQYPATAAVQVHLLPRDFFEPVEPDTARSCIPAGGKNFSYFFDANVGRMTIRGESMFPPISVTFHINDGAWNVIFFGRCMQITQPITSEDDIDSLLTNCEHTIPALLSVITGLAIFCETLKIRVNNVVEASSETLIPPNAVRIIEADSRIGELSSGIALFGVSCSSLRFRIAANYFREALYFDSAYNEHNPYTHSLNTILKCAQAIEVLFGGRYDSIRQKCRDLGVSQDVIESEIVRINLTRNQLGSAHASGFVPTPVQTEVIRHFARRATHTVQQLLLLISKAKIADHPYLIDKFQRDSDKDALLKSLNETLQRPLWCIEAKVELRSMVIKDPRLGNQLGN